MRGEINKSRMVLYVHNTTTTLSIVTDVTGLQFGSIKMIVYIFTGKSDDAVAKKSRHLER